MPESQARHSHVKRYLLGCALLVATAAVVIAFLAFAEREQLQPPAITGPLPVEPTAGPRTLLLIGSDKRAGAPSGEAERSDTMMLVRLDPRAESINVLSIPRDLRVRIPGYGSAKFNESFSVGGPSLVLKTIKANFGIPVNNVAIADFRGFRKAVDRFNCVYTDIDRHYLNKNDGFGERFAEIDIEAGYQKLCGSRALDYVRFRHYDSDFFRGARQQAFLRQAKQQVDVGQLVTDAAAFRQIAVSSVRTDRWLTKGKNMQRFIRQAAQSANKPVAQIAISKLSTPTLDGASVVIAPERSMRSAAARFLNKSESRRGGSRQRGSASSGTKSDRRGKSSNGVVAAKSEGLNQAVLAGFRIGLPVAYPTAKLAGAVYDDDSTRPYRMETADNKRVSAYRIVAKAPNSSGDYYGVQGVYWDDPPILKNPSEERKIGGRNYLLYYEGSKLGLVAFKRDGASYWVSNTLTRKLTEKQMLAIAKSLRLRKKGG